MKNLLTISSLLRVCRLTGMVCLILISCDSGIDCDDMRYFTRIELGNRTGCNVQVQLYPKEIFMRHDDMYQPNNWNGGYRFTDLEMDADSTGPGDYSCNIYSRSDTLIDGAAMLAHMFDSISFQLADSAGTIILLKPGGAVNYQEDPFQQDSLWLLWRVERTYPDNDCENPAREKIYKYYLDPARILFN